MEGIWKRFKETAFNGEEKLKKQFFQKVQDIQMLENGIEDKHQQLVKKKIELEVLIEAIGNLQKSTIYWPVTRSKAIIRHYLVQIYLIFFNPNRFAIRIYHRAKI